MTGGPAESPDAADTPPDCLSLKTRSPHYDKTVLECDVVTRIRTGIKVRLFR
jgi:hypothetical protein